MRGSLFDSTILAGMLDATGTALQVHVFITTYTGIIGYYFVTHYNRFGCMELTDYVRLGHNKIVKNVRDRKQTPGDRNKTVYLLTYSMEQSPA